VTLGDVGITQPTDVHAALATRSVGERVASSVRRRGELRLFAVVLRPKPNTDGLLRQLFLNAPASSLSSLTVVSGTVAPSLSELRGKVVVLEFWASFCGACRALTPTLNAWNDAMSVEGVRVLGITTDPFEEAERAAQQLEIRYPVFVDGDGAVSAAYQALALPTLFVIDKQGVVRDVMVGFDSRRLSQLEVLIRRLAAEPGPSGL
jgi:thiol-disulfide isomerase/thioredoxin